MQVLIAISGFCPRIGNVPCTTPFDFLFVISIHVPTWGTTLSISTNLFALIFQSTFPRGERRLQQCAISNGLLFPVNALIYFVHVHHHNVQYNSSSSLPFTTPYPHYKLSYYTALVHLYQCIQSAISYDNLPFSISYTTFIVETLWDTRTTVRRVVSFFRDLRMMAS